MEWCVLAHRGWAGENKGLSEQPAGHAHGIRELTLHVISEVVAGSVNTLLASKGDVSKAVHPRPVEERMFCDSTESL